MRLSGDDMDHWIAGEVHGFASSLCQQGAGSRMGKVREGPVFVLRFLFFLKIDIVRVLRA